jgi:hypothetical protein
MSKLPVLKSKAMLHPIRSQLFVMLHTGAKTAQELCDLLPEVPAGSIYRHLNILLHAELICVEGEEKVRGPSLRRFAPNHKSPMFSDAEREIMEPADTLALLQTLLATIESKGRSYVSGAHFPLTEGVVGMAAKSVLLTDEEYQALRKVMVEIYAKTEREPPIGATSRFIGYFAFPEKELP